MSQIPWTRRRELGRLWAYWQTVEFVLRRGRDRLAIEVMQRPRYTPSLLTGLRALAVLPHLVRRVLVYRGREGLHTEDGTDVWPADAFVEAVAGGTLWP